MKLHYLSLLIVFLFFQSYAFAQSDTLLQSVQQIPVKYFTAISDKADKYTDRISSKTEKTLSKLAKWETKIQSLLQKADPATAQKLFGEGKLTFNAMLKKVKAGEAVAANYRAQYDGYRDKLTTSIGYIENKKEALDQKYVRPVKKAKEKMNELNEEVSKTEMLEKLIKDRKKELSAAALKTLGKTKYAKKLDKEVYYYAETLKNYKDLFHDKKKAEDVAMHALNKMPGFTKFMRENSMLASMFRMPGAGGTGTAANAQQNLSGLQTRASVNAIVQQRIDAGGPGAREALSQNMQAAQAELTKIKDRIIKAGGGSGDIADVPSFRPNSQKSKLFKQRLELGSNFQITKPVGSAPAKADVGLSLGYKLNDKSVAGVGFSYKMGYGTIQKIRFSSEGLGFRSFIDWKIKKQFFLSGGYELNYNSSFSNIRALQDYDAWQRSGLIGLTKKLKVKTKFFKETKFQLLYDILFREHNPVTQPVVFRSGFNF